MRVLSIAKIWDKAKHNAFTDLIRYAGKWYCTFRESDSHMQEQDGKVRIIESVDGKRWKSTALFQKENLDLRDPKFSITPSGTLMLLLEGARYTPVRKKYSYRRPFVAFSDDVKHWTPLKSCMERHEWPWRATWFGDKAYTVSYRYSNPKKRREPWEVSLYESLDGIHYNLVVDWDIPYYPSEVTLRFLSDGTMIALVRRGEREVHEWNAYNWIGVSRPPYKKWKWNKTKCHLGGPNFLILPDRSMWAAGRILYPTPYGIMEKVAIARMTERTLTPQLLLPSAGDSSYPGMVFENNVLWVSYYASHEGRASIYLARIKLAP